MVLRILLAMILATVSAWGAQDDCLRCHGESEEARVTGAPLVDLDILQGSIHAQLDCNDCHNVNSELRHVGVRDVLCGRCHMDAAEDYAESPHVEGLKVSIEDIPTCVTCHGGHEVLAVNNPDATTNHRNSVSICIRCHEDQSVKEKFDILPEPRMIKAYENSVHGRALLVDGNMDAPACVDCHGSHSFKPSDDPESPIFKTRVSNTCGSCHTEIAGQYNESLHGTALAAGVLESPTCTNCHGEHDIQAHGDPISKVYASNVPRTCSDCHASELVVGKFGLKADRIATFNESFHGVGIEFGESKFANCASCHGVHNIYPQSDRRSLINAVNIETTCGKCHEDLPADFVRGAVHTSAADKSSGGKFYVRQFYIWFITILIVGFVIYRVLEYKRRVKRVQ